MAKKFATIQNTDLLETLIRELFSAYKIKLHHVAIGEHKGALVVQVEGDFWYKNKNQTDWAIKFHCKRTSVERLQYFPPEINLPTKNTVVSGKHVTAFNNALQDRYTEVLRIAQEQAAANMLIHEHGRIVMKIMGTLAVKLGENYFDSKAT